MSRNISAGLTPRAAFPCTCNGCRGWVPELYPGASESTVIEATRNMGSHYFDADTRRFFRSRVLSWGVMHDGAPYAPWGFTVRESKAAGWNTSDGRVYSVTVWCRFGSLVAVWRGMRDGLPVEDLSGGVSPFTRAESERAVFDPAAQDEALRLVAACSCHGCAVWGSPWEEVARRCLCPSCGCDYKLDDYAPGENVCGACVDNCAQAVSA